MHACVCARARVRAGSTLTPPACARRRRCRRRVLPHLAEGLPGREEVLLAAADEHVAQRALLVRRELQRHPIN
jgi:hypothetical protein